MDKVFEYFGCDVFNSRVMRDCLSQEVFEKLNQTIRDGKPLDKSIADEVAEAMKDWAVAKGATHFTHWFQPLTGITAEKHDSFISPDGDSGILMEFSGKELIKGEPDASSFPSGGIRATFEARGYTAWDPTSYAFIKDKVLYIPTAFCSYSGEALDKKTPLLRSMEALNTQAVRALRLLGNTTTKKVVPVTGIEQEYFLVDKKSYDEREDLIFSGRTLFGTRPPKGQELDDHYFGVIKPRVQAFMDELNETLWRLGIPAKTEHNEVAPSQHELAPIYEQCNIATDHNQLTMEVMQKLALKHGLVCLLHEKPFAGVNGSGKHNNWSLATDDGQNLLSPGKTPYENVQFLFFLVATIKAVSDYQDLLRLSVATAGNDHRLGASEAPPAIVSIFLGDELTEVLNAIESGDEYVGKGKLEMKLGVSTLPVFSRDTTDRNRTSPFAFTGNKFEFRMLGSSNSTACADIMLNAAVADTLRIFSDELEKAKNKEAKVHEIIKDTIVHYKNIIFNGNGYDDSWVKEAEKRGLLNLKTTPDCIPCALYPKNVEMLTREKVFTETELKSRYEIHMENYCKTVLIEAKTMEDMAKRDILPAISSYMAELSDTILSVENAVPGVGSLSEYETDTVKELGHCSKAIYSGCKDLGKLLGKVEGMELSKEAAFIRDKVIPKMDTLRADCDKAETLTDREYWPFPGYAELLFNV